MTLAEDIIALFRAEREWLDRALFDPSKTVELEQNSAISRLAARASTHISKNPATAVRLVLQALSIQLRRLEPNLTNSTYSPAPKMPSLERTRPFTASHSSSTGVTS